MNLPASTTVLLFSGAMLFFGIVGLIRGELEIGGESETLWIITGRRAIVFSLLLIASGIALLMDSNIGFGLFIFTMAAALIFQG